MFRPRLAYFIALTIVFCLSHRANADTLILQSGQKVEGQIIQQTELRVTVNVQGAPYTFFLGEIVSIDGKKVEMPQDKAEDAALTKAKNPIVQYYNDEEDSLVRFMNKRKPDQKSSVPTTVASPVPALASPAVAGASNKAVIATPDGGIIVVSPDKITKYDKDFKVIKEVSLNSGNPPASK